MPPDSFNGIQVRMRGECDALSQGQDAGRHPACLTCQPPVTSAGFASSCLASTASEDVDDDLHADAVSVARRLKDEILALRRVGHGFHW